MIAKAYIQECIESTWYPGWKRKRVMVSAQFWLLPRKMTQADFIDAIMMCSRLQAVPFWSLFDAMRDIGCVEIYIDGRLVRDVLPNRERR